MIPLRILFSFLLPVTVSLHAQTDLRAYDYRRADSIARHCKKQAGEKYTQLAHRLTDALPTQQEKFRAIYRWVAENLEYSEGNYTKDPGQLLKKGKTVCIGYATLLKDMCDEVGLECELITGYARNEASDVRKRMKKLELHAWNAIRLDGRWHLVDATWSSGDFDAKTKKYTPGFDPVWFLGPPEFFIRTHFPNEKKWQLLNKKISAWRFLHRPVCYTGFETARITSITANRARLCWLRIPLKLTYRQAPGARTDSIGGALEPTATFYAPTAKRKRNGAIKVKIPLYKPGTYSFYFFVNGKAVASYRVRAFGIDPDEQQERRNKRAKKREQRWAKRAKKK